MLTPEEIMQLIQSLIWLLAGVGVFIARLTEGKCNPSASPYYSSLVAGLERVADHLVNVGYSVVSPIGEQVTETIA